LNSSSNGFDLRQVVGELKEFVTSRNWDSKASAVEPSSTQIEMAILAALASGPKNAHQTIDALLVASAGTLSVGAAQIHPALNTLSEAGSVSGETVDDRKVFSITNLGLEALAAAAKADENETENSAPGNAHSGQKTFTSPSWLKFDPEFLKAASQLAPVISDLAKTGTRAQQEQATKILQDARHQLHKILAEN
jgi:DNA-binding PadR family transcriptional regulator